MLAAFQAPTAGAHLRQLRSSAAKIAADYSENPLLGDSSPMTSAGGDVAIPETAGGDIAFAENDSFPYSIAMMGINSAFESALRHTLEDMNPLEDPLNGELALPEPPSSVMGTMGIILV